MLARPVAIAALKRMRPRRPGAASLSRRLDVVAGTLGVAFAAIALGPIDAGFAAAWWIVALVVVRSDLQHFIIPDKASGLIAMLGLAHAIVPALVGGAGVPAAIDAACYALAGGAVAFGLFWAVAAVYEWSRGRQGLGFGDVKLAGASALWLDTAGQGLALEVAALAAVAVVLLRGTGSERLRAAVPFGAFLAPAAWLAFVAGPMLRAVFEAPT